MDFNEAALKERLETAVSGTSPDVGALMDGGLERGERLRRRRRTLAVGTAGLTATAVTAVVYSGLITGVFDTNSTVPADPPDHMVQEINRPATGQSLAVVAVEHLPGDRVIAVDASDVRKGGTTVSASVGLATDHGKVQLDLIATTRVERWDSLRPCAPGGLQTKPVQCFRSSLEADGELVVVAEKLDADRGPVGWLIQVIVRKDDQLVVVLEYVRGTQFARVRQDQPVTSWDLPVSVDALKAIATDPRFGVLTTQEMIARGHAFDLMQGGMVESGSGTSGAVRVSPKEKVPGTGGAREPPPVGVATTSAPERPRGSGSSSGP